MSSARIVNGPMQLVPNGNVAMRTVTISNTSANVIVAALDSNTTHVWYTLTGGNLRVTTDGSTPTASYGHQIPDGTNGVWPFRFANALKAIREGATDGVLTLSQHNTTV
jgi:hypothetical protein